MTKEEAIENIKLIRFNAAITNANSFKEALDIAIEALSQPSLPSNLDEAAEEYFKQYNYMPKGFVVDAFKSGAEWMAGQGVSWEDKMTYYDGFLIYGQDERAYTMEGDFNEGDKVVVQIRKK